MRRAHTLCPYSNATRGNIDVTLRVDSTPLDENDLTQNKAARNEEEDATSGASRTQR
jgi:hypothetical protein